MSFLSRLRAASRALFGRQAQSRGFAATAGGNAYNDWIASATSADTEIRGSYRKLIDRSRSLERDNDYQRGFLLSCQRNINGAHRYDLRSDAGELVPAKAKDGQSAFKWQPDLRAKALIEEAWKDWGKKGSCVVDKRTSWRALRRLAVRSVVRDGNFLARKIRGKAAGNKFGFALQIWEIDHLDLEKQENGRRDGHTIRFGIEFDAMNAPVAYWLRARHPGDYYGAGGGYASTRFEASEVYHLCLPDRAEQSIGYPWVVSAITRLRQLGAFEEAAVIAARVGATNQGFFKKVPGPNGEVGTWTGQTDSGGAVMDAGPGASYTELPSGWDVTDNKAQYPNIETGDFRKAMLRGVCSSLGVSYTNLGNDLESVNFSSARVGLFEEREGWKELQLFFTEELWEPIFADWLESAIMAGAINLPIGKFAKFNRPVFKARRWAMIDPLKEINALREAIGLKVDSRRNFIENQGGDVDEVFQDNVDDENLAEDMGLSLATPEQEAAAAQAEADDEDDRPAKPTKGQKSLAQPKRTAPDLPPININVTVPPNQRGVKVVRDDDGRFSGFTPIEPPKS